MTKKPKRSKKATKSSKRTKVAMKRVEETKAATKSAPTAILSATCIVEVLFHAWSNFRPRRMLTREQQK
jgi:hypothetical protein